MNEDMKIDSLNAKSSISEFPSNSKAKKEEPAEEKKVKKVITGKVITRKKPLSTKFAELVWGEGSDMHSVINYVLQDVLIPSAKSTISDMVNGGIEMLFFGTTGTRRGRGSSSRDKSRTSYSNYYKEEYRGSSRDRDRERDLDRDRGHNRAKHNFDDIVLETRGEAEEVVDKLMELISTYEVASVADFYATIDMTSNFTDQDYGWDNITSQNTRIERLRQGGYVIHLPKPKPIK